MDHTPGPNDQSERFNWLVVQFPDEIMVTPRPLASGVPCVADLESDTAVEAAERSGRFVGIVLHTVLSDSRGIVSQDNEHLIAGHLAEASLDRPAARLGEHCGSPIGTLVAVCFSADSMPARRLGRP